MIFFIGVYLVVMLAYGAFLLAVALFRAMLGLTWLLMIAGLWLGSLCVRLVRG